MHRFLFFHLAVLTALQICTFSATSQTARKDKKAPVVAAGLSAEKLAEIDQATFGYADRFVTLLSDACDKAAKDNPSADARRAALRIKLHNASSAYSIVTASSPLMQLLDLTTMVTLGHIQWVDEGQAKQTFGSAARPVEEAFSKAHQDIWALAGRFLSEEDLAAARQQIVDWRKQNPEVGMLAYVRFDDFGSGRSAGTHSKFSGGFFSQLSEANRNIDETRQLAQRALYFVQRAPRLIQWQVERSVEAVLEDPDVKKVLADVHMATTSLRDVADEIKRIDERHTMVTNILSMVTTIVADAGRLGTSANDTVREGGKTLVALKEASATLTDTLTTADRIYSRINSNGPVAVTGSNAMAFDIREYTRAAEQVVAASREMNTLVRSTEGMIASHAWTDRVGEVSQTARDRVDHITLRAIQVMVLFFLLLLGYRWLSFRMGAPRSAEKA
jgi:hypothetical protein